MLYLKKVIINQVRKTKSKSYDKEYKSCFGELKLNGCNKNYLYVATSSTY